MAIFGADGAERVQLVFVTVPVLWTTAAEEQDECCAVLAFYQVVFWKTKGLKVSSSYRVKTVSDFYILRPRYLV